jgi:hypothetical protein
MSFYKGCYTMTDTEFGMGLTGELVRTKLNNKRLCSVVSEALREHAKEVRAGGRPDVAGRLSWLAGQLDGHRPPTKRILAKLRKDIDVVRSRLVDGEPIAVWD